ncbi:MAG: DUF3991 and toprim domain-containing protein [Desulfobacterales bacterium]|nr:DUF3991 and toprim domain-containing protein [Desulfobacterales bacterium]
MINLTEFAASIGYRINKKKSSEHSVTMVRGDSKLIIAKNINNGHWIYFERGVNSNHGTIIDLCEHEFGRNLGKIRKRLSPWKGFKKRKRTNPDYFQKKVTPCSYDKLSMLSEFSKLECLHPVAKATEFLTNERMISFEIIFGKRFSGQIFTDKYNNVCFPHRNLNKDVVGWEKRNQNNWKGFPEGGTKAGWFSNRKRTDNSFVITESGIDTLSLYELFPERLKHTWCISTSGGFGKPTLDLIQAAHERFKQRVIVAVDNDKDGRFYEEEIKNMVGEIEIIRPNGKDFNDDLMDLKS